MNRLSGTVPSSLYNISSLEEFSLMNNQLQGTIPFDIGFTLPNLIYFSVSGNNFTGNIPSSLSNMSRLEMLQLQINNLVGSIPYTLGNLKNIEFLGLGSNKLGSGEANDLNFLLSLVNCTKLRFLDVSKNNLGGEIPNSIANLTTIFIPPGIQNLLGLTTLYLNSNQLTGSIPPGNGLLQNMGILSLSSNKLFGPIPSSFCNLTRLIQLYLFENNLTVLHPSKNIMELYIGRNKLYGEITSSIGECSSLIKLSLDNNFFQGTIPSAITSLKGLESLTLSHNNLSGVIPKVFENLTTLIGLDLSYNNLEGAVPNDGVFENASRFSIEGNSKLCGGIPVLKLPNCSVPLNPNTKLKQKKSMPAKVIIIIIVVVLFVTSISKNKLSSTSLDMGERFKGVSYNELLKATNGFNDTTNLLGAGSFGSVYKGILSHQEPKPVAVKLDIEIYSRLYCCSSTDFQGNPFKALVFEFMVNGSLENWLHPNEDATRNDDQLHMKNLNLETRLKVAVEVASALNYLHHDCESPIVHCDLKTSNVLLNDDLIAHVGEFGLAKFLHHNYTTSPQLNEQNASSIEIKGSIGYVAPEYGTGGEVSAQDDVYSYGILLLEMFPGKTPTDNMFKDGLNIHSFSKVHAFPERVLDIVDSRLLLELENEHLENVGTNSCNMPRTERRNRARHTTRKILASIIQIAVICSSELPSDRMSMNEDRVEVQAGKNHYLGFEM
ncbi:hypothetical protein MKX03_017249 [Papaver bracteatum]|nr:hypothetical protein MKX03_017249 [Papaver bracteatum]